MNLCVAIFGILCDYNSICQFYGIFFFSGTDKYVYNKCI